MQHKSGPVSLNLIPVSTQLVLIYLLAKMNSTKAVVLMYHPGWRALSSHFWKGHWILQKKNRVRKVLEIHWMFLAATGALSDGMRCFSTVSCQLKTSILPIIECIHQTHYIFTRGCGIQGEQSLIDMSVCGQLWSLELSLSWLEGNMKSQPMSKLSHQKVLKLWTIEPCFHERPEAFITHTLSCDKLTHLVKITGVKQRDLPCALTSRVMDQAPQMLDNGFGFQV